MFKKLSLVTAGALVCLSLNVSAAEKWRAWNIHNDGHPNTAAMDEFAKLVGEATDGEVELQVFHGGVLGNQPDALEQVRLGALMPVHALSTRRSQSTHLLMLKA